MHTIIDTNNADQYQGGFCRDGTPHAPELFLVRPINLPAGKSHAGHAHYIDHVGNLLEGQARIEWRREDGSDEGVIDMLVPSKVLIRADTWHRITALTDMRWECWFARSEAEKLTEAEGRNQWYLEKNNG